MSVQLHGTAGIDGVSINSSTPNSGNFTSVNISTGVLSATTGQNLNLSTNGSQKLRIDTNGNLKLLAAAGFQNATSDAFSPYVGLKNKIINGDFDIWQRATVQSTSGYGSNDHWGDYQGGSVKVHSRQTFPVGQTDVPNNPKYFSRTTVTSVAGASNFILKNQYIEDVTKSSGKTYTLSFWAKADASKNIAVEFLQYFGTGGSPSTTVSALGITTFALTTTWQKFTTTVTFPSVSGKLIGTNGNDAYGVNFWFDAGSTYNSRTNSLGQQSGVFDLAQVQLEEGSVATPFESRPISLETALCQRYYEQIYGVAADGFGITANVSVGCSAWVQFNTPKRVVPSVSISGTWAVVNCGQPTGAGATTTGARISTTTTASLSLCSFASNSTDDFIIIDAEIQ
jgi:hypothetical protein